MFGQPLLAALNEIGWPRWHRALKSREKLGLAPQILLSSRDYEAILQTAKNKVPLPSELAVAI